MAEDFVHLHVHTEYSMLDGASRLAGLIAEADRLGMRALAITDHGNLSGAYDFHTRAKAAGVKPMIGEEMYISPAEMTRKERVLWGDAESATGGSDAEVSGGGAYTHLTVVATDARGLRALFRMQRDSYDKGYYRKNRIDRERLAADGEGLIVLSGCASGELATRLRLGQYAEADEVADWYKQHFGNRFYIEVMCHAIPWERKLNEQLIGVAERHGIETVATNDSHYTLETDSDAHAALLCVQAKSTLAKPAMSFDGHGYFLRSRAQMDRLGLPKRALDNTVVVAERIGDYDDVFQHRPRYPEYPVPDGWTPEEALRSIAERGLQRRVGVRWPEYADQLDDQLDVICQLGYAEKMLVVMDLVQMARQDGIFVGPGRGSAGGSLVAYAIGITDIDPIRHGLLAERFLNMKRPSRPDIDIDIADKDRPRFIELAAERYGPERVAQIGTVMTFGAKAALRDACRVLDLPPSVGDARAAMLPRAQYGRQPGLDQYTGPRDEVYDVARVLEGGIRGRSVHASGMAFAPVGVNLADDIPLERPGGDGPWVTGWTDAQLQALGFDKEDFLGLRNLTIIADCLKSLERRGVTVKLPVLPEECNDRKTYELLANAETLGVFQLDGKGMRSLLRLIKCSEFRDILAVLALFRPGPMGANAHVEYGRRKNSGDGVWQRNWAIHPELESGLRPVLEETYGLIVFQEQVLKVLAVICGWSYEDAELLFNAMRKKDREKMEAAKPGYFQAGAGRGFSAEALQTLWDVLVPFADYSFNKAHSAAYGTVAYWTAYLKANYPVEYMAATLTSVADDKDRRPEYLAEVNRMGIKVLPPSVIHSELEFSPGPDGIHYGLGAIRGVGESVYRLIEAARDERPFTSLRDFLLRVDSRVLGTGTLTALVQSGALDDLCPYREELATVIAAYAARAVRWREETRMGQYPLLGMTFPVGSLGLRSAAVRQAWEKTYLGVKITQAEVDLKALRRLVEADLVWLRGVVAAHPGHSPVRLLLGAANVNLPSVDWTALESTLASQEAFSASVR